MSSNAEKKKAAMPMIMIVFCGIFLLLSIGSIIYVLSASGSGAPKKEITKQYPRKEFVDIAKDDRSLRKIDQLEKRFVELQEGLNYQSDHVVGLREEVRTTLADLNRDFTKALNDTRAAVNHLNERLDQLEKLKTGVKEIRVIKPRKDTETQASRSKNRPGKKENYKVQAVVEKRAWISVADDMEQSVVPGDDIAPPPKTARVDEIDERNGTVITSSN